MRQLPDESGALWFDDDAGPMVRPYTVTRGRTRSGAGVPEMDVIAIISAVAESGRTPGAPGGPAAGSGTSGSAGSGAVRPLGDEHLALLVHCRAGPLSVADLAAEADLPLGVVRILLGDLLDAGRVRITQPVPPAELPDVGLLNHLINGLKSL